MGMFSWRVLYFFSLIQIKPHYLGIAAQVSFDPR